jgi:hypothetical protein
MVCAAGLFACASARPEKAEETAVNDTVIRGMVHIYGSEPHTYVGIASEDGKTYAVEPREKEAELRSLQGWRIEFTVRFVEKPTEEGSLYLKDGTVTPISWTIVTP